MRAGVTNRLHGAIVAVMELALFFLPISVISYMPTLFYGELLGAIRDVTCALSNVLSQRVALLSHLLSMH